MNSTNFRLESVLRWRESQRDELRQDWAEACREEERLQAKARQLCLEIADEQSRRRGSLDAGTIALDALRVQHHYELSLREELELLRRECRDAAQRREGLAESLAKAQQQVEVILRLKAGHDELRTANSRRREQFLMDEAARAQAYRRAA